MKDHFSEKAKEYARFRPTYPDELFHFILCHVNQKKTAWDCGTGNGQVAVKVSAFFESVYATDPSKKQIANASKRNNINYQVMTAEEATFPKLQFDLITVAQAIHWFDFSKFYQKVQEYLKPGGVIAVIGYDLVKIDRACDRVIHQLYTDILGDYWDPERKYVENHYRTIPFPFEGIPAPEYQQKMHWSLEQLTGYLNTWSSVQRYIQQHGQNPLELVREQLERVWGENRKKAISFPVFVRAGRVG